MMIRALMSPLAPNSRLLCSGFLALLVSYLLSFMVQPGVAQTAGTGIADQLDAIKLAEHQTLSDLRQGYLWAALARSYQNDGNLSLSEQAYAHALRFFAKDPAAKVNYAVTLDNLGSLYLDGSRPAEAESVRKKALAIRIEIGEPLGIARGEVHLAEVALTERKFKDAEKRSRLAYEHLSSAGVASGHPDTSAEISALVCLTYAQGMQSEPLAALASAEKAQRLVAETFASDSAEQGHVALALGFAQWKTGASVDAERNMREGIRILRLELGERNPLLLGAMYQYRDYLKAMHRKAEVASVDRLIAERKAQQAPQCGGCLVSVFGLR